MKDYMTYKDYYGSVHYSDEDQIFFGKVEFIKSLISFEGTDVKSLKKSFEQSVDDYLSICKEKKIVPEKSFKGSFNVRVTPTLHGEAVMFALEHETNLNTLIKTALENYLKDLTEENSQLLVNKKIFSKGHGIMSNEI